MNNMTGTISAHASNFATAWRWVTQPLRLMVQGARTNPVIWTAILMAAGAVSFYAKSYHLGTVLISAVGILWMWQDMLDGDANMPEAAAVPVMA